jgi:hypothetical protein
VLKKLQAEIIATTTLFHVVNGGGNGMKQMTVQR